MPASSGPFADLPLATRRSPPVEVARRLPDTLRPVRPRSISVGPVAAMAMAMLLSSCVNPARTAARGEKELERHRHDPLLAPAVAGLALISSSDRAAYAVENDPVFPSSYPTTFTRTFDMAGLSPAQVFAGYDRALTGLGAVPALTHCEVSVPRETRVYSATTGGDAVVITVAVEQVLGSWQTRFNLEVSAISQDQASAGLRDCLTVRLPASAYVAAPSASSASSASRSGAELCALVKGTPRVPTNAQASIPGVADCAVQVLSRSVAADVTVTDLRTTPLVQVLDRVAPGADPAAARFVLRSARSCSVILPTLPSGMVEVRANAPDLCDELATQLLR